MGFVVMGGGVGFGFCSLERLVNVMLNSLNDLEVKLSELSWVVVFVSSDVSLASKVFDNKY